jgi:hypothetical protein
MIPTISVDLKMTRHGQSSHKEQRKGVEVLIRRIFAKECRLDPER